MESVLLVALIMYFVPTVIAAIRGHKSVMGIFFFNLIFGFTGILWIAAFIWAWCGTGKSSSNITIVNNQQGR